VSTTEKTELLNQEITESRHHGLGDQVGLLWDLRGAVGGACGTCTVVTVDYTSGKVLVLERVLFAETPQYSTVQHSTAHLSTGQHSSAQHSTTQQITSQHSATQHSASQRITAHHSRVHTRSDVSCYMQHRWLGHRPCGLGAASSTSDGYDPKRNNNASNRAWDEGLNTRHPGPKAMQVRHKSTGRYSVSLPEDSIALCLVLK
jgi:hypothetical protein